ncbi:hypothetical protein PtrSN002B_007335 [Pyrenophora tritici-repentis]|uniref:Uncharacterized protein n=1 Tax=Pyrenophora tritici-repentis TaxID=45151 RepID=A0A2W1DWQ3_9PLEO|nr:hypothetical protein PtrV1_11897 [Pyrenophora tritici-repentis]KAF7564649.1 hypothetical protein PtrM4_040830 [Pyrenophora tritici-repentis]KAI0574335.1 hypothetical protein Alg215_08641 [Pyrenophora tritici-repentis]KAI0579312.1 hypothetical protein Alg130_07550 [Pyrenophora tritici-repentis]KAI0608142.1 hypothetical protein TUN205_07621 [Pyrenophora tritici-repentis]
MDVIVTIVTTTTVFGNANFPKRSDITPMAAPVHYLKARTIPKGLDKFAVAEISSACACLKISPFKTITLTITAPTPHTTTTPEALSLLNGAENLSSSYSGASAILLEDARVEKAWKSSRHNPPPRWIIQPDTKDHTDGKEEIIWRFGGKAITYQKRLEKEKDLDDAFLIWK